MTPSQKLSQNPNREQPTALLVNKAKLADFSVRGHSPKAGTWTTSMSARTRWPGRGAGTPPALSLPPSHPVEEPQVGAGGTSPSPAPSESSMPAPATAAQPADKAFEYFPAQFPVPMGTIEEPAPSF